MQYLGGHNIRFDNSSLNVFQNSGCYFQGFDNITIGKNVWIAQNVGIITANHDLVNPDLHTEGKPVYIGDRCWIGMNAVILPGVVLGENTVVGAGSVVTKSFEKGHCVIAGNPARLIKETGGVLDNILNTYTLCLSIINHAFYVLRECAFEILANSHSSNRGV